MPKVFLRKFQLAVESLLTQPPQSLRTRVGTTSGSLCRPKITKNKKQKKIKQERKNKTVVLKITHIKPKINPEKN